MQNKWRGTYQKISEVDVSGDYLIVRFAKGDAAKVKLSALEPPELKKLHWNEARIEGHGLYIRVPAEPEPLEIPWDIVRRLTDPEFARDMSQLAEKQSRYIGARLRELRTKRGLTQAKVSVIAGIEPANLSRIENGHYDVSTSTLWKLLAAMGYSARDLASERRPEEVGRGGRLSVQGA